MVHAYRILKNGTEISVVYSVKSAAEAIEAHCECDAFGQYLPAQERRSSEGLTAVYHASSDCDSRSA